VYETGYRLLTQEVKALKRMKLHIESEKLKITADLEEI